MAALRSAARRKELRERTGDPGTGFSERMSESDTAADDVQAPAIDRTHGPIHSEEPAEILISMGMGSQFLARVSEDPDRIKHIKRRALEIIQGQT